MIGHVSKAASPLRFQGDQRRRDANSSDPGRSLPAATGGDFPAWTSSPSSCTCPSACWLLQRRQPRRTFSTIFTWHIHPQVAGRMARGGRDRSYATRCEATDSLVGEGTAQQACSRLRRQADRHPVILQRRPTGGADRDEPTEEKHQGGSMDRDPSRARRQAGPSSRRLRLAERRRESRHHRAVRRRRSATTGRTGRPWPWKRSTPRAASSGSRVELNSSTRPPTWAGQRAAVERDAG